jgi:hypothetical protein
MPQCDNEECEARSSPIMTFVRFESFLSSYETVRTLSSNIEVNYGGHFDQNQIDLYPT